MRKASCGFDSSGRKMVIASLRSQESRETQPPTTPGLRREESGSQPMAVTHGSRFSINSPPPRSDLSQSPTPIPARYGLEQVRHGRFAIST